MTKRPTAPSTDQLRLLHLVARRAGLDHAALHAEACRRYGVASLRDLSRSSYQGMLRLLRLRASRFGRVPTAPGAVNARPGVAPNGDCQEPGEDELNGVDQMVDEIDLSEVFS